MTFDFDATSEVRPLDTERILQALRDHDVEYILIGGLAAIAHGSSMATLDADLLPRLDDRNLDRLLQALTGLEARLLVAPSRLDMEAGEIWEVTELRHGGVGLRAAEAWHFSTVAGAVDVVMTAAGVGTWADHRDGAEQRLVFGIPIEIAGRDDLIRSKSTLDRPKDREVIRELRDSDGGGDPRSWTER